MQVCSPLVPQVNTAAASSSKAGATGGQTGGDTAAMARPRAAVTLASGAAGAQGADGIASSSAGAQPDCLTDAGGTPSSGGGVCGREGGSKRPLGQDEVSRVLRHSGQAEH